MKEENKTSERHNDFASNDVKLQSISADRHRGLKLMVMLLAAFLLVVGAYLYLSTQGGNYKPSAPWGQKLSGNSQLSLVKSAFAVAGEETALKIKPATTGEAARIAELSNLKDFEREGNFSAEAKKALEEKGFFLTERYDVADQSDNSKDDFYDMYEFFGGSEIKNLRSAENAVFVSSDSALHFYHLLIDRSFQRIEERKFQPLLRQMTATLYADSLKKYQAASDPKMKDSYALLSAYYLVPLAALDAGSEKAGVNLRPQDYPTMAAYLDATAKAEIKKSEGKFAFELNRQKYPGGEETIYKAAEEEITLINKAESLENSPLFAQFRSEFSNDYSQFTPRSHYTKNDVLKSYFIAMMWYGRMGFQLTSPELTRDALNITTQINTLQLGNEKLSTEWDKMASAIDFFVGEADDLTAYDYTQVMREIYAGKNLDDATLADDSLLSKFQAKAKQDLPAPKIVSEALDVFDDAGKRAELLNDIKQFRFFPQRFTPDAYIINNLTQGEGKPDPKTGQLLPTVPTALMPLKVIAPQNAAVSSALDEWIKNPTRIQNQRGRESDKIIPVKIAELQKEFSAYDDKTWNQNIYWSWLNCFRPLLSSYGEGYPFFMKNSAWQNKNLGTVLGSYTELKHDTLLYAKQSYAEGGGGSEDELPQVPPVPKGYVEADLLFWNRINNLAEMTKKGLQDRNLMPDGFQEKYDSFIETHRFFQTLAEKELQNAQISDDEFEKLRLSYLDIKAVVEPVGEEELEDKDKRAGIVADIHTDAVFGQILYESTGKPLTAMVAIKDANGTRLTTGPVYRHYEFLDKLENRLTDEKWQEKVYDNKGSLPPLDNWTKNLIR